MNRFFQLLFLGLFVGTQFACSSSETKVETPETGQQKFTLTHLNGKELDKNAVLSLHKNHWELDMKNGDIITYTILFKDEMDPLCGLKAVDTFKDTCMICASIEQNKASIDFIYSKGKITYTGFFE